MHLRKEHNVNFEDITEIICTTSPGQIKRNFEPEHIKYTPPTGYAAISSIPYMVSASLVEGQLTLAEVTDEKVKDPRILQVAQKVKRAEEVTYRDYQNASVEIKLRDGRVVKRAQTVAVGSPEMPASQELVEDKFRKNAKQCMSDRDMDKLIATVLKLEKLEDLSILIKLLRKNKNSK